MSFVAGLVAAQLWIVAGTSLPTPGPTLLTVQFDTLGEGVPGCVCIVADFIRISVKSNATSDPATLASLPRRQPTAADRCLQQAEKIEKPTSAQIKCLTQPGSDRTAIIRIADAEVGVATLDEDVARIQIRHARDRAHDLAVVELKGGDYHPDEPISLPVTASTQFVKMTLTPLRVSRQLRWPRYAADRPCSPEPLEGAHELKAISSNGAIAVVETNRLGGGSVRVKACEHEFHRDWAGRVPPPTIELETRTFSFSWRTTCLSGLTCPPSPIVTGSAVSCHPSDPANGLCSYTCEGAAHFPAEVQFTHRGESWSETLNAPGDVLSGRIPGEQRTVRLAWDWTTIDPKDAGARSARADRTADRIFVVELRTPEGTVHNVHHEANQIRIPELNCNDFLFYRYLGDRTFRAEPVKVDAAGSVTLRDPSRSRPQSWGLAASLGAGELYFPNGVSTASWGPQGHVQTILVFRQLRDYIDSNRFAFDLELHAGAIFSGQPYCSSFAQDKSGLQCRRIRAWRFPFTGEVNFLMKWPFPWAIGGGTGIALATYHSANDSSRISRRLLGVARVHLGFRIGRSVTLEPEAMLFLGEYLREREFDSSGVASHSRIRDSGASFLVGGLVRLDDPY